MLRTAAVLIIAAAIGSNARPTTPSGVALTACYPKTCNAENSKFNYLVGHTYVYDYESYVSTCFVVEGTDNCDSDPTKRPGYTAFTAKVHLTVENACEMSLSLSDVAVSGVEGATDPEKFAAALTAQPTMFSFVDGTIEDVCTVSGDAKFAVNVKKAIISSFQHTGENFSHNDNEIEVDLNGECKTYYEHSPGFWNKDLTIVKTTTLGSCIRNEHGLVMPGASVNKRSRAGTQNIPLAQGSLSCNIKVKYPEQIYTSVECAETQKVKPRSVGPSFEAKSEQKLSYMSHAASSTIKPTVNARETLEYSHDQAMLVPEVSPAAALEKLCDEESGEDLRISPTEKVNIFMNIVTGVRAMKSKDEVKSYMDEADQLCDAASILVGQAIPFVRTSASSEAVIDLLGAPNPEYPYAEAVKLRFLKSVTQTKSPSKSLLTALSGMTKLDQSADVRDQTYMAVGGVVSSYCVGVTACDSLLEVSALLNELQEAVGNCQSTDRDSRRNVIAALAGFGNAANAISSSDVTFIKECLVDGGVDTEVKLATVRSTGKINCEIIESKADDIFELISSDDFPEEVQIAAYLTTMRCASRDNDFARRAVNIIYPEGTSNSVQVTNFVFSHLVSTGWVYLFPQIRDMEPYRSMLLDPRGFSRFERLRRRVGRYHGMATIDSSVVYTPESPVPRSASINVTVEAFGKQMNLLEMGLRAEGTETLFDSLMKNDADKEPSTELTYDSLKDNNRMSPPEMRASMYMKLFGNNVGYKEITPSDITAAMGNDGGFSKVLEAISSVNGVNMLVDHTLMVPAANGLPLLFRMQAASTIDNGINVTPAYDTNAGSFSISVKINPKAAVELRYEVAIGTYPSHQIGIAGRSNLYTNTNNEFLIESRRTADADRKTTFSVNFPGKQEILAHEHDFYTIVGETRTSVKPSANTDEPESSCLTIGGSSQNVAAWGSTFQFCVERAGWPISLGSPHRAAIVMKPFEGSDISGFQLEAVVPTREKLESSDTQKLSFVASIIKDDESTEKKFSLIVDREPRKSLKLTLTTPYEEAKSVVLGADVIMEEEKKSLKLTAEKNGEQIFQMNAFGQKTSNSRQFSIDYRRGPVSDPETKGNFKIISNFNDTHQSLKGSHMFEGKAYPFMVPQLYWSLEKSSLPTTRDMIGIKLVAKASGAALDGGAAESQLTVVHGMNNYLKLEGDVKLSGAANVDDFKANGGFEFIPYEKISLVHSDSLYKDGTEPRVEILLNIEKTSATMTASGSYNIQGMKMEGKTSLTATPDSLQINGHMTCTEMDDIDYSGRVERISREGGLRLEGSVNLNKGDSFKYSGSVDVDVIDREEVRVLFNRNLNGVSASGDLRLERSSRGRVQINLKTVYDNEPFLGVQLGARFERMVNVNAAVSLYGEKRASLNFDIKKTLETFEVDLKHFCRGMGSYYVNSISTSHAPTENINIHFGHEESGKKGYFTLKKADQQLVGSRTEIVFQSPCGRQLSMELEKVMDRYTIDGGLSWKESGETIGSLRLVRDFTEEPKMISVNLVSPKGSLDVSVKAEVGQLRWDSKMNVKDQFTRVITAILRCQNEELAPGQYIPNKFFEIGGHVLHTPVGEETIQKDFRVMLGKIWSDRSKRLSAGLEFGDQGGVASLAFASIVPENIERHGEYRHTMELELRNPIAESKYQRFLYKRVAIAVVGGGISRIPIKISQDIVVNNYVMKRFDSVLLTFKPHFSIDLTSTTSATNMKTDFTSHLNVNSRPVSDTEHAFALELDTHYDGKSPLYLEFDCSFRNEGEMPNIRRALSASGEFRLLEIVKFELNSLAVRIVGQGKVVRTEFLLSTHVNNEALSISGKDEINMQAHDMSGKSEVYLKFRQSQINVVTLLDITNSKGKIEVTKDQEKLLSLRANVEESDMFYTATIIAEPVGKIVVLCHHGLSKSLNIRIERATAAGTPNVAEIDISDNTNISPDDEIMGRTMKLRITRVQFGETSTPVELRIKRSRAGGHSLSIDYRFELMELPVEHFKVPLTASYSVALTNNEEGYTLAILAERNNVQLLNAEGAVIIGDGKYSINGNEKISGKDGSVTVEGAGLSWTMTIASEGKTLTGAAAITESDAGRTATATIANTFESEYLGSNFEIKIFVSPFEEAVAQRQILKLTDLSLDISNDDFVISYGLKVLPSESITVWGRRPGKDVKLTAELIYDKDTMTAKPKVALTFDELKIGISATLNPMSQEIVIEKDTHMLATIKHDWTSPMEARHDGTTLFKSTSSVFAMGVTVFSSHIERVVHLETLDSNRFLLTVGTTFRSFRELKIKTLDNMAEKTLDITVSGESELLNKIRSDHVENPKFETRLELTAQYVEFIHRINENDKVDFKITTDIEDNKFEVNGKFTIEEVFEVETEVSLKKTIDHDSNNNVVGHQYDAELFFHGSEFEYLDFKSFISTTDGVLTVDVTFCPVAELETFIVYKLEIETDKSDEETTRTLKRNVQLRNPSSSEMLLNFKEDGKLVTKPGRTFGSLSHTDQISGGTYKREFTLDTEQNEARDMITWNLELLSQNPESEEWTGKVKFIYSTMPAHNGVSYSITFGDDAAKILFSKSRSGSVYLFFKTHLTPGPHGVGFNITSVNDVTKRVQLDMLTRRVELTVEKSAEPSFVYKSDNYDNSDLSVMSAKFTKKGDGVYAIDGSYGPDYKVEMNTIISVTNGLSVETKYKINDEPWTNSRKITAECQDGMCSSSITGFSGAKMTAVWGTLDSERKGLEITGPNGVMTASMFVTAEPGKPQFSLSYPGFELVINKAVFTNKDGEQNFILSRTINDVSADITLTRNLREQSLDFAIRLDATNKPESFRRLHAHFPDAKTFVFSIDSASSEVRLYSWFKLTAKLGKDLKTITTTRQWDNCFNEELLRMVVGIPEKYKQIIAGAGVFIRGEVEATDVSRSDKVLTPIITRIISTMKAESDARKAIVEKLQENAETIAIKQRINEMIVRISQLTERRRSRRSVAKPHGIHVPVYLPSFDSSSFSETHHTPVQYSPESEFDSERILQRLAEYGITKPTFECSEPESWSPLPGVGCVGLTKTCSLRLPVRVYGLNLRNTIKMTLLRGLRVLTELKNMARSWDYISMRNAPFTLISDYMQGGQDPVKGFVRYLIGRAANKLIYKPLYRTELMTSLSDYVMPRSAAYVFGRNYFSTFDYKDIEIKNHCHKRSLLMAHDARGDTFTIKQTFDNNTNNDWSLDITFGEDSGKIRMTPYPHFEANTDDARKSFYVKYDSLRSIIVSQKKFNSMVTVRCSEDEMCKISLSGIYHGALIGVLGNNNKDITDDSLTGEEVNAYDSECASDASVTDLSTVDVGIDEYDRLRQSQVRVNGLTWTDVVTACEDYVSPLPYYAMMANMSSSQPEAEVIPWYRDACRDYAIDI